MKTIFCIGIATKFASNRSAQLSNILAEVNVHEKQIINKKSFYVSFEEVDAQLLQ